MRLTFKKMTIFHCRTHNRPADYMSVLIKRLLRMMLIILMSGCVSVKVNIDSTDDRKTDVDSEVTGKKKN